MSTSEAQTGTEAFFERPILNSPYERPMQHWELDESGQPTQKVLPSRRRADFVTPIPKPKKRKSSTADQQVLLVNDDEGISTQAQQYDPTEIINGVRSLVEAWRSLPNPNDWQVTPETARLLKHWRHHQFSNLRPFFCQVELLTHRRGSPSLETRPHETGATSRSGQCKPSRPSASSHRLLPFQVSTGQSPKDSDSKYYD